MTLQARLIPGKYRLTVEDFLHLDEAGVFETSRTELLDGDIIIMNAEYRPHGRLRDDLCYRIRRSLEQMGSDLTAMGASVRTSDHDLPLPDVALTREPTGEGPIPVASVALIVEIASTTLSRNMGEKIAIYARAGIPEYWVADLTGRVVHQMWSPVADGYANRRDMPFGGRIAAATVPGLEIQIPET